MLKPALEAIWEAIVGASTIAKENDMVYKAAYCPLVLALLRLTQKLFIKGNSNISPNVTMIIPVMVIEIENEILSRTKEIPINNAPAVMYSTAFRLFSNLYTRTISTIAMIKPFMASIQPIWASFK